VNMRFVKPLDEELVRELAASHGLLVTVEDNTLVGGAGSAVNECLAAAGLAPRVLNLGLPDRFVAHASQDEQMHECGLDGAGIEQAVLRVQPRPVARRAKPAYS